MTPAARVAAVIELAETVDAEKLPADQIAATYLARRRYIGSSDRRAISLRLWRMLRTRARTDWWLNSAHAPSNPRSRAIADLVMTDRLTQSELIEVFDGHRNGPGPLSQEEKHLAHHLRGHGLDHRSMPLWVRCEFPGWLEADFKKLYGDRVEKEMGALAEAAPVDLRVNTLKTDYETARAALAAEGVESRITPHSPLCLRLPARTALTAQAPFRDGLIEVQDEGSQVAALLVGAKPGETVVDYCAGAGGKTLALAAAMENKGRLIALDSDATRLERAAERLKRAGVHNVTRRVIDAENERWLRKQEGMADRVLVDAPCTGSGAWRRNPDAKWRLTADDLDELCALQTAILIRAAKLVKPGGRLVYVTCSLLAQENEARVNAFLAAHVDFAVVPIPEVWAETLAEDCPTEEPVLRLSPARHDTDGFFVVVMERAK